MNTKYNSGGNEDESLADLFHELAQSNIATVRAAVASKAVISEETVANLASDSSPEVIEELLCAQCRKLSESALAQIIQRNWSEANRRIAQSVEGYYQSDITAVAKLLAGSADPSVRATLASNGVNYATKQRLPNAGTMLGCCASW